MSFVPQIAPYELPGSIVVPDVSGAYAPNDNPTGYGVQNIIPQWITAAALVVVATRSGRTSNPIDVTGVMGIPQVDGNYGTYQVLPWDLGMEKIESEKYTITYTVSGTYPSGSNFSFTTTASIVTTKEVECCVDKTSAKTLNTPFDSLFRDEPSRTLAQMSVLLRRAKDEINKCGDLDAADRIVFFIRRNCNCNC
jgi:hypothetical protein